MSQGITKEDLEYALQVHSKGVEAEIKHVNEILSKIESRFDKLPCDRLDNEVAELRVKFDMRVAEFQKEADNREKSLNKAWDEIREIQDSRAFKSDVDEMRKDKDKKMWWVVTLLVGSVLAHILRSLP